MLIDKWKPSELIITQYALLKTYWAGHYRRWSNEHVKKSSHSENGKLKTIDTKSRAQKEIRVKTNSCRLFTKCITLILSMYMDM